MLTVVYREKDEEKSEREGEGKREDLEGRKSYFENFN